MKDLNYWDRFLSTGRIEDYLAYRAKEQVGDEIEESKGVLPDAGQSQGYRDDIKG